MYLVYEETDFQQMLTSVCHLFVVSWSAFSLPLAMRAHFAYAKRLPSNQRKLLLLRAKVTISVSSLLDLTVEEKTVLTLKIDGKDLTNLQMNTLLNHFTAHHVQLRRDEKREALSSWEPIVEDILAYVRERLSALY